MATKEATTQLISGRKGLTLVLSPKARIELAHTINTGLKEHTLKGVSEASTLSPETIITRSHDTGRSASGERMSLWSFVGLTEGLHLDTYAIAASLGVELMDEDIRRAKDALELRRLRIDKGASNGAQVQATFTQPDLPGRFADALTASVARRMEQRIEEIVEQKLLELLGTV